MEIIKSKNESQTFLVVGPRISLSESYKQLAELKKIDISEVKNNDDYEKLREKLTQYNAENKSKK